MSSFLNDCLSTCPIRPMTTEWRICYKLAKTIYDFSNYMLVMEFARNLLVCLPPWHWFRFGKAKAHQSKEWNWKLLSMSEYAYCEQTKATSNNAKREATNEPCHPSATQFLPSSRCKQGWHQCAYFAFPDELETWIEITVTCNRKQNGCKGYPSLFAVAWKAHQ